MERMRQFIAKRGGGGEGGGKKVHVNLPHKGEVSTNLLGGSQVCTNLGGWCLLPTILDLLLLVSIVMAEVQLSFETSKRD